MSICAECEHFKTTRKIVFADEERNLGLAAAGHGVCGADGPLKGLTLPLSFGCNQFTAGSNNTEIVDFRPKATYEVWDMVPCPVCAGGERCSGGCMCAGTGLCRQYGDGLVVDDKIRDHPKTKELARKVREAELRAQLEEQIRKIDQPPELSQESMTRLSFA